MGTITNICFWDIDKIGLLYAHCPGYNPHGSPVRRRRQLRFYAAGRSTLLTYGTDGKPIGDPRWGTNYVDAVKPEKDAVPAKFTLAPVYPNPFNPTTNLSFSLAQSGFVSLAVYDLRGVEVSRIMNESLPAGDYHFNFDGRNLNSGVYICRLTAGGKTLSRKMVLIK
jgi:hypothetical protein